MDFEDGILRPVWILSDGILSRRGKLRRDSEIEPKYGPGGNTDTHRNDMSGTLFPLDYLVFFFCH